MNPIRIPSVENAQLEQTIRSRLDMLTKPPGSLGFLEDIVVRYGLCRGNADAAIRACRLLVFAADHGITAEGVSPYPSEVTGQMVRNMLDGGAAIAVLCRHADVACQVVDMGVRNVPGSREGLLDRRIAAGTRSFLTEPAMTRDEMEKALAAGQGLATNETADLCGVGEMGIGNTSSAAALVALLLEREGSETVGAGTGADGKALARKREVIQHAVTVHRGNWDGSPEDALARVGGFEIAGMIGYMLGCAERRVPVVVDGFIATAAALCALRMSPALGDYLFYGHCSAERFHAELLDALDARPILHLDLRLGEGTGAALAMSVIRQALACYCEMATFADAGVSNRES